MLATIIIFICAGVAGLVLPWWWGFAPIVAVIGFWKGKSSSHAFLSGFVSVFALWLLASAWLDSSQILGQRLATMFGVPHAAVMYAITALVGGILAGFSALAGFYGSQCIAKKSN